MSSVVLISVLLYQSAAFVFLDGSQVSERLVRVSYGEFGVPSACRWQLFLLCALMTVADCCDLVVFFVHVFSTLCLQVGNRLGF